MDFYIWDGVSSIMGLTASTLIASRPDFKYEPIIVIHKKGDKNNVVMIETASELKETYDIQSNDLNVIGKIVSVIMTQEDHKSIKEQLKELDEENSSQSKKVEDNKDKDIIQTYMEILDEIMKKEIETYEYLGKDDTYIPLKGEYNDPKCRIIDLSDVSENVKEKKLTAVIKHAFVVDLELFKCMEDFNDKLIELGYEREKYIEEGNFEASESITRQIESMKKDIEDPCDATIKIDANTIYQYENLVMIDCVNGQCVIIDAMVLDSINPSALEYEKHDNDEKYKVHYKTVNINLNNAYNEVLERGNTIFVVSV